MVLGGLNFVAHSGYCATYLEIILIWSFESFQVLSVPGYFEEAHTQLCQPMTLSRDTTLFQ